MINSLNQKLDSLRNHSGIRKHSASLTWMLCESFITLPIEGLVAVYVIRYLGPAEFGTLSYALSLAVVFSPLVNLGLHGIVVRELVHADPNREKTILGTAFVLHSAGSVALIAAIGTLLCLQRNSLITNISVMIIATGSLLDSALVLADYNRAKVQQKYTAISLLTAKLSVAIFKVSPGGNRSPPHLVRRHGLP